MIPISTLLQPSTADAYLAKMISVAQSLQLSTTSWQEGDPTLTILEIMADVLASRDAEVETAFVASGLLDFAADPAVTPEPVRGEIYTPGWLDMTADQLFDTQRLPSTYAVMSVSFVNTTGQTLTFVTGTYHVQDPSGLSTYSNTTDLTIPAGSSGPVQLQADVIGAGQVIPSVAVVQVPLLAVTFVPGTFAQGQDTESNASLVTRSRGRFKTLSLGGPAAAYDYFAKTIPSETPAKVKSGLRTVPLSAVTKTLVQPVTGGPMGAVDMSIVAACAAGAYAVAQSYTDSVAYHVSGAVVGVGLVTITTTVAHGYTNGDSVYLSGIGGITGINNSETNPTWQLTVTGLNTFTVPASASGGYSSGGTAYRVSDLDLVKRNFATYCQPEGILVGLSSAVADNVTLEWYATIKATGATQAFVNKVNAAIAGYIASIPIGGYPITGGQGIPFGVLVGTIWAQDPINVVAVHVKIAGVLDTDYAMSSALSVAGITSLTPTLITDSSHLTVV